jgi:hypothetical protein
VRLLIALFVARMVVTAVEVSEQRLTFWSLFITAAIGLEAWRAWTVSRVVKRGDLEPAPLAATSWDRFLRPIERAGPSVLYSLTGVFLVAAAVLLILGNPHDALLDVALVCREVTTLFFLTVIVAGYMSVRRGKPAGGDAQ